MFLVECMKTGSWISECESLACIPSDVANITSFIYNAIRIVTPLILVIIGMFDMTKAITAGKEDEIQKAQQLLIKRGVAAVIIFLLFSFITWGLSILNSNGTDTQNVATCLNALFNTDSSGSGTINFNSECQKHGYDGNIQIIGVGDADTGNINKYVDWYYGRDKNGNVVSNSKSYYNACYKTNNNKCTSPGMPDNGKQYILSDGNSYCIIGNITYDNTYIPTCGTLIDNTSEACNSCCRQNSYANSIFSKKEGCTCVK